MAGTIANQHNSGKIKILIPGCERLGQSESSWSPGYLWIGLNRELGSIAQIRRQIRRERARLRRHTIKSNAMAANDAFAPSKIENRFLRLAACAPYGTRLCGGNFKSHSLLRW